MRVTLDGIFSLLLTLSWSCTLLTTAATAEGVQVPPAKRPGGLGCYQKTISSLVSPDGDWIAMVHEDICSGPGLADTGITDTVHLARPGDAPQGGGDVLAVDTNGDVAQRPILHWVSPRRLGITVPNKSLIGLQKQSYDGVEVFISFDPNDPAARERWLKSLGLAK